MITKIFNRRNLIVFGFFALYFIFGLASFKDYGVPIDEFWQENIGYVNLKYVAQVVLGDIGGLFPSADMLPELHDYLYKDYGPLFEMGIVAVENALGIESFTPEASYIRHLIMFITFFISMIFLFLLLEKRFGSLLIALLGVALAIVTPRFYAESFYNTKDILFYSFVIISAYFVYQLIHSPKWIYAVLGGLFTGLTISLRFFALIIPFMVFGFIVLEVIRNRELLKGFRKANVFNIGALYLVLSFVFLVLTFPYLWENPVGNFLEALASMSAYSFHGQAELLYFGKLIPETDLPWHYIPVWIAITTPILVLVLFLLGIAKMKLTIFKEKAGYFKNSRLMFDLFVVLLMFLPLLAVIVKKSVLYNGWRHMYFAYFTIIYMAVLGLSWLIEYFEKPKARMAIYGIVAVVIIYFAGWNIKYHPYQYAYFNKIAGSPEKIEKNFPVDYWGLSYKQSLEYLLNTVGSDSISIRTRHVMGADSENPNFNILTEEQKSRFVSRLEIDSVQYYLTEYYQPGFSYKGGENIYSVKVNGYRVHGIYKLK